MEDQKPSLNIMMIIEENSFLQQVANHISKNKKYQFIHTPSVIDAERKIKTQKKKLDIIFVDHLHSNNEINSFIDSSKLHQPSTPIFLIIKELEKKLHDLNLKRMGIQGTVKTPEESAEIINIIENNLDKFDGEKAIQQSKETLDPLVKEGFVSKDDFIQIKAKNFLSGKKSYFDVYINLKSKFLKILEAGDVFEPERLNQYLDKGLEFLYVRKSAHKYYVDYCNTLTEKILNSKKISTEIKLTQSFHQGEEIVKFLQQNGLDDESLQYANTYATNVHTLISNISAENKGVEFFLKDLVSYEHAVGTSMLAGLMGRKFGLQHQKSTEILGLAATLHDIGLYQKKNNYSEENDLKYFDEFILEADIDSPSCPMQRKQQLTEIYHKHPQQGAEIISEIKNINSTIPQIVSQHHMRYNNTGFPKQVGKLQINPLAEIIGICDEFEKIVRAIANFNIPENALQRLPEITQGFSGKIRSIFSTLFLKESPFV